MSRIILRSSVALRAGRLRSPRSCIAPLAREVLGLGAVLVVAIAIADGDSDTDSDSDSDAMVCCWGLVWGRTLRLVPARRASFDASSLLPVGGHFPFASRARGALRHCSRFIRARTGTSFLFT